MNKKIVVYIILIILLSITIIPFSNKAVENKNYKLNNFIDEVYCISLSGIDRNQSILTYQNKDNLIKFYTFSGEVLDQHQDKDSGSGYKIHQSQWCAQSFTPTLKKLTGIRLRMFKAGDPPEDEEIILSIRESLKGEDITSITLTSSELPPNNQVKWICFDFEDIEIIPNNLYYMICKSIKGENNNCYAWVYAINNPYKNGDAWMTLDYGVTWLELNRTVSPENDFCFETYGWNTPPEVTITGLSTGKPNVEYEYIFNAIDTDEHNITQYKINWGDGINETIYGPFISGQNVTKTHIWAEEGTYIIKAKAYDIHYESGDWATLEVTMLKTKLNYQFNMLLERFLYRFPVLGNILNQLL